MRPSGMRMRTLIDYAKASGAGRWRRAIAAALALGAMGLPFAAPAELPAPVARALARAGIPESAAAFYVHEIGAKRPLLAAGASRPMNPASVIKLLTTYGGLEVLGPAYTWSTEAYAAGTLRDGVLAGDLVIKGGGDPKLTIENFWLLLRSLRARGLREIRGDLMLDRSFFGVAGFDPSQFDGEPIWPYNTGPDALLVNFKAVRLQFIPDADARAVRILVEPPLPEVQIVNHIVLDNAPCTDWLGRIRLDVKEGSAAARLAFGGHYATGCGERERYYSVLGHSQYVLALFRELWQELGGTLAGTVRNGTAGADARLMATVKSPSLSEIVRDINKYSNNVMARHLFLTLGAVQLGAPATTEKGSRALREWLAGKGLSLPELVLENGAGLSRVERISARSLGEILLDAYKSPVMPELIASLPVVAVDGTMRKRLNGAAVAGQAHVKTGSLAGVRAIAGYVLDAHGRRVVMVFMVNHANAGNAQVVQDALLDWVYTRR